GVQVRGVLLGRAAPHDQDDARPGLAAPRFAGPQQVRQAQPEERDASGPEEGASVDHGSGTSPGWVGDRRGSTIWQCTRWMRRRRPAQNALGADWVRRGRRVGPGESLLLAFRSQRRVVQHTWMERRFRTSGWEQAWGFLTATTTETRAATH